MRNEFRLLAAAVAVLVVVAVSGHSQSIAAPVEGGPGVEAAR